MHDLKLDPVESAVNGRIRIKNQCATCNHSLTEATFHVREEVQLTGEFVHAPLMLDVAISREALFEGEGRGRKTFYAVTVQLILTCSHCNKVAWQKMIQQQIQASDMELSD